MGLLNEEILWRWQRGDATGFCVDCFNGAEIGYPRVRRPCTSSRTLGTSASRKRTGFRTASPLSGEFLRGFKRVSPAPTYSCPEATIGADRLNCRVRKGIGCFPVARDAGDTLFKRCGCKTAMEIRSTSIKHSSPPTENKRKWYGIVLVLLG